MKKKTPPPASRKWKCYAGCRGKTPCRHLERFLSEPGNWVSKEDRQEEETHHEAKKRLEKKWHIENVERDQVEYDRQSRRLEQALLKFGIQKFEVDLLMDKYVSKLTLKEIAENRGYMSPGAVWYLINRTLKVMRDAGLEVAKKILKEYD